MRMWTTELLYTFTYVHIYHFMSIKWLAGPPPVYVHRDYIPTHVYLIYTHLCVLCPFGDRGEEPRSIGAKLLMAYFPEEPLGFRGFRKRELPR